MLKISLEVLETRARPLEVLLDFGADRREVRVVEKRVEEGVDAVGRDSDGFRGASRGKTDVEGDMENVVEESCGKANCVRKDRVVQSYNIRGGQPI